MTKKILLNWATIILISIWYLDVILSRWNEVDLSVLSQILSSVAAILNLVFIVSIFFFNKKEKSNEVKLARKSYWFRNIILDKNIDKVHECYDDILEQINRLDKSSCDDNLFQETVVLFQDRKRLLIATMDDMIRIIDKNFAENLDILLDDFEDEFTNNIEELFTCQIDRWNNNKSNLIKSINDSKAQYLKKIYAYEKDGYLNF